MACPRGRHNAGQGSSLKMGLSINDVVSCGSSGPACGWWEQYLSSMPRRLRNHNSLQFAEQ